MSRSPILLAAGGTGGHLFPAFALAQELDRRGWPVELVTEKRGERYGADFPARAVHHVPAATLTGKSPAAVLRLIGVLVRGVWAARGVIRRVGPAAMAGFGGYPTFPPMIAARLVGVPALLHEQNAVMGRANRALQHIAAGLALSFEPTRHVSPRVRARARLTGNPVRDRVIEAGTQAYDPPETTGPFRLVVFGGSQGARYFSDTVPPALAALPESDRQRLRVVQQCREEDMQRVRDAYAQAKVEAELDTFFADLPARLAAAHLVIARSGASTVAELAVLGRPAILVPYSHALDNDQLENATRLEQAGGAWCLREQDLTPQRLADEIARRMADPGPLEQAAAAARSCGKPDAVKRLADMLEQLAEGRR